MDQQKIGKFIAKKRKEKKLTQVELADKLGVSNRTISKWENGNSMPDYSIFNDLCKELDISINELLSGEELTKENYQKKLEENIVNTIDYNNKKRNKKIIRCIIVIVIIAILYILYKLFIIYYYDKRNVSESYNDRFPYNKNIQEIEIVNNNKANKVFEKEINIFIPDDFELTTDKAKTILVEDDCDLYVKNLTDKNTYDASIKICNRFGDDIFNLEHFEIRNSLFPYLNVNKLLKEYNINNTIDLLKYYEKTYDEKYNIFTSSNKIKMHYIAKEYSLSSVPPYDNFYYLNGNLKGYLTEWNNNNKLYYNIVFYTNQDKYNQNAYNIQLYNYNEGYFNHENILEIVNSIYKKNNNN